MFLQLLVSELQKAPDLNSEIVDAEARVERVKEAKTISDVEELCLLRDIQFECERNGRRLDLPQLEASLVRAKHFQTATAEAEEIFV